MENYVVTHSRDADTKDILRERALKRKITCKRYYERHKERLRAEARERAAKAKLRRLECETPDEAEARKTRHKLAAARHRAALKNKL
ncbi:hypothetical protein CVT26_009083 [Gymnopilus dilepis]|uniref:Uncharacterized protein n=1 Tax=Gymnopilus dilepis TaxID=231916 RepID=A0A409X4E9_9AGAR|nr:hypothetical protein CVT26_009083 [Gymnopilus dilepis]